MSCVAPKGLYDFCSRFGGGGLENPKNADVICEPSHIRWSHCIVELFVLDYYHFGIKVLLKVFCTVSTCCHQVVCSPADVTKQYTFHEWANQFLSLADFFVWVIVCYS